MQGRGLLFAIFFLIGFGCLESPSVPTPPPPPDAGGAIFADTVIGVSTGGVPRSCTATLPPCNTAPTECSDVYADIATNDGTVFNLGAGGSLEVGFRCSVVVEHGGMNSPELKIWSTVPSGSTAVVEVSLDGSQYQTLDVLASPDQTFDLARIGVSTVRFVRIADSGSGGIGIDAVEAP
jgi:hypothetical protein